MNLLRVKVVFFLILLNFCGYSQKVNRIISLAPSITENIYLLDAADKLVGCTSYCTQAVNDGITKVGSTIDINVEQVFALQPDLVLTMELTKSQDIEAMKKLGIKVEIMETPINFDEICSQTLDIAKLIGAQSKGEKVISDARISVEELKEKSLQNISKKKIFFQIGANPIFTVLQNTFMDDFIIFCNGQNIASEMKRGTITRESVLLRNPDVIIIASMGGFGLEEKKVWQKYKSLEAVKKEKVFLVDSETSCSPTPANFVKALTDIYQSIIQ